jgi:NADP-dependent 3-hydroxy acid dehydrogenase YdfG
MTSSLLADRSIVIAGAGSGMGRATALAEAEAGAKLVLIARTAATIEEIAGGIRTSGGFAIAVAADVSDHDAAAESVRRARSELGRIDALVNTVGTNIRQRALSDLTARSWADMLAVNLTAAFNLTQAVVPVMREQADGVIVHVSSSAAKKPDPSGVAYQATKAGLVGLTYATMEEERANGIRTTVIFPGLTDTPMMLKRPTPTPPEVLAKALQPEDVAAAVPFVLQLPARAYVPELLLYPSQL